MSVLKFKNASNEWQEIMTIIGAQGPEGPAGPQGLTGPAPVKGVDYWTESEKQDLVNEIKSEVGGSDLPLERGTGKDSLKSTTAGMATGEDSLALGPGTYAMENGAFAIGIGAECLYKYAMALGNGVKVSKDNQTVLGTHNIKDENAMIVIGTGSTVNRRNGMTINANNQVHFPGTVVIGENKDTVATTTYVDNAITKIPAPEIDLSAYALKTDIPDVSGFITMSSVEAKGYQTANDVATAIATALSAIGVAEEGAY